MYQGKGEEKGNARAMEVPGGAVLRKDVQDASSSLTTTTSSSRAASPAPASTPFTLYPWTNVANDVRLVRIGGIQLTFGSGEFPNMDFIMSHKLAAMFDVSASDTARFFVEFVDLVLKEESSDPRVGILHVVDKAYMARGSAAIHGDKFVENYCTDFVKTLSASEPLVKCYNEIVSFWGNAAGLQDARKKAVVREVLAIAEEFKADGVLKLNVHEISCGAKSMRNLLRGALGEAGMTMQYVSLCLSVSQCLCVSVSLCLNVSVSLCLCVCVTQRHCVMLSCCHAVTLPLSLSVSVSLCPPDSLTHALTLSLSLSCSCFVSRGAYLVRTCVFASS